MRQVYSVFHYDNENNELQFSHNLSVWKFYIFPIFTFSLLYNIPKFLELTMQENNCNQNVTNTSNNNQTECIPRSETSEDMDDTDDFSQLKISATSLRLNPSYVKYYLIYLNFLIHAIIPLIILVVLNSLIFRQVGRRIIF